MSELKQVAKCLVQNEIDFEISAKQGVILIALPGWKHNLIINVVGNRAMGKLWQLGEEMGSGSAHKYETIAYGYTITEMPRLIEQIKLVIRKI